MIATPPGERGIAQPGSAEVLGTSGRRFKSCCPDHLKLSRPATKRIAKGAREPVETAQININPSNSIASKPRGCASATLVFPEERGFFRVGFCAAGEFNNTKSVSFAPDTDFSSEIYRFLKRAVPIKRVDFAVVALDSDLVNH
jgi:hypothetical protein